MRRQPATLLIFLSLAFSASAADLPPDQLRQGEARQSQIRAQTQDVADQLGAIIEEFRRNGLDGDDVAVLSAIRSVLHKLSDQEMRQVIALLQSARSASDIDQSRSSVVGAVATQKNIAVQLRALLLEYQRQQALYDLSIRLSALAQRQHENLKATVALTRAAAGKTGSQFDENQRANLSIQTAEQQALKDEINPLLAKLETLAADADGPTKDRLAKAMDFAAQSSIRPELESAVEDLRVANLYRAAGTEKSIRDDLRDLARLIAPPKDALAALRQAAAQLEKAIDHQKQLIDETRQMRRDERWRDQAEALESRQADLVDTTDQLQKDLEALSPEAVNELKQGQDQMQEARADLTDRNRDQAIRNQSEALKELQEARQALQQAMATAEPVQNPGDRLAAARGLQERTRELIRQQESLSQDTTAKQSNRNELKKLSPRQDQMENDTRALHRDAVAALPDAARAMNDAAGHMDKAAQHLARPDNPRSAEESQAAAVASLKEADEQLTAKIAQLEEAKQEMDALAAARDKVENLIRDEQNLQTQTAKAAATPEAQAPTKLAQEQSRVAQETGKVRDELPGEQSPASAPLEEARQQMTQAKARLDQTDAKSAQPAQQQAVSSLFKAKKALDERIDQLRDQLGQPADPAQAIADAMQQIEGLKEDVALADQAMTDPAKLGQSLVQRQKKIADELAAMDAQPPGNATLPQAQQAAASAADQLARGQLREAAQSMAQAQKGMQVAKKSPAAPANLPEVSQEQARLQNAVEQLAEGKPLDPAQEAAEAFEQASSESTELAAGDEGALPSSASQALQQAAQSLAQAAAAAAARQSPQASQRAADAQAALSQAAAALSLAQAGLGSGMAQKKGAPAQGKGTPQAQNQQAQNQQQGQGQAQGRSAGNRTDIGPGQSAQAGAQRADNAGSKFLSLPDRDRKAIAQSQNDKYPEEYAPQIEQYLRNLSDQEPE